MEPIASFLAVRVCALGRTVKVMKKPTHSSASQSTDVRYMSVKQLARRWGISIPHAYALAAEGVIPTLRAGAAIRVEIAGVEEYERRSVGRSA